MGKSLFTLKILVTAKDPFYSDIIKNILADAGYNVIASASLDDAIVIANDHKNRAIPFNVAIIDTATPDADVIKTASAIRLIDQGLKLIALTAEYKAPNVDKFQNLKIFDYILNKRDDKKDFLTFLEIIETEILYKSQHTPDIPESIL